MGLGIGKAQLTADEHVEAIDLMREIKDLLDPKGILHPGKLLWDSCTHPPGPFPQNAERGDAVSENPFTCLYMNFIRTPIQTTKMF